MFDFHLHTRVSHDSSEDPSAMVKQAEALGLREICFTDHYDATPTPGETEYIFDIEDYLNSYGSIASETVKIRRGVEFGLVEHNVGEMERIEKILHPDYVIGSVHFADGFEIYTKDFWQSRSVGESFRAFLLQEIKCAELHDNFDVFGHINYACKSPFNPTKEPLPYKAFPELFDKLMKIIIEKDKGIEINTSGVDRVGIFLPDYEALKRFKELGGKKVTVGSDAHVVSGVGQYTDKALEMIKDVFGYVCTFEKRDPIYHKL